MRLARICRHNIALATLVLVTVSFSSAQKPKKAVRPTSPITAPAAVTQPGPAQIDVAKGSFTLSNAFVSA